MEFNSWERVINIHRVAIRNGPTELLAEANYLANFGLEGDWRSRKGRAGRSR